MFSPYNFQQFINSNILNCNDTLILGCGEGRHELELKGLKNCLGIDICNEKLNKCKYKIPVINIDIRECNILDKSFDTVTAYDLIEHFTKAEALGILVQAEKIARHQIILFIPIQETLDNDLKTLQDLQESAIINKEDAGYHLSLWTEKDLIDLGYTTYYSKDFHGSFGALIAIKKLT